LFNDTLTTGVSRDRSLSAVTCYIHRQGKKFLSSPLGSERLLGSISLM